MIKVNCSRSSQALQKTLKWILADKRKFRKDFFEKKSKYCGTKLKSFFIIQLRKSLQAALRKKIKTFLKAEMYKQAGQSMHLMTDGYLVSRWLYFLKSLF